MTKDEYRIRHSDFVIDSDFWFRHWSLPLAHLLVIGIWSLGFSAHLARADDSWLLTTADFQTEHVVLSGINNDGVAVRGASEGRRIPMDRLLMLDRVDKPAAPAAKFVVILSGNDRAAGQPKSISGENLVWETASLGELTLPLRSIVSIVRPGQEPPQPPAQQTEDVATLANGDSVRGIVSGISAASVSVQQPGGDATEVPLDSLARIAFAATAAAPPAPVRGFRVSLADGSAITTSSLRLADQTLALSLPDGSNRTIPLPAVVSIEQINGPVVWLSSLKPIEAIQTPFLELTWPARMDRAVDGEPIRFGGRTYSRGIGVHSYSRLTFAIDPAARAFRTQYAVAADWTYANVTVRIKLDGKVIHEQVDVRSGTLPPAVLIDLNGQKQLTLEVDYGQDYDVQDRFNWIEPAFLKMRPMPPATAGAVQ